MWLPKPGIGWLVAGGLFLWAIDSPGERRQAGPPAATSQTAPKEDWNGWSPSPLQVASRTAPRRSPEAVQPSAELDVVDAHWMALTMWGEARNEGELGMRAVGHVIRNRVLSGSHGTHVTDTVSEAYQFSCWNAGDPNRDAIFRLSEIPKESRDYRMWITARRVADEILSGRSEDPTEGALFYHSIAVEPRWSRGVPAVRHIGKHTFYRSVA